MRRSPFTVASIALAASAASLLLSSCPGHARPIVALDEAFSAARPALAALLDGDRGLGVGPLGLFGGPLVASVALSDGAGAALDAALAEQKRSGKPGVLITSPLIAKAIAGGGAWSGLPPLLVPEWHSEAVPGEAVPGASRPGLWSATSDPIPAYRAAGSAAGAFVAALSKMGGSPSCGLLFTEAPSRPRAALTSFAAAYAEASEGRPLYVRELGGAAAEASGSQGKAPQPAIGAEAEAAVAELLGSDIRVLFVALGPDSSAAIRAAARPGLALGADFPYPEDPPTLAFKIIPDDSGLARALVSEYRAILGGARGGEARTIPSLLVAGAAAGSIRAGKPDFRLFLENAALRAKGTR
jgi:hypothetical protein